MSGIAALYEKVKPGVFKILEISKQARNNNLVCVLLYWRVVQKIPIPEKLFRRLITQAIHPETICRIKRELQAHGIFIETPDKSSEDQMNFDQLAEHFAEGAHR